MFASVLFLFRVSFSLNLFQLSIYEQDCYICYRQTVHVGQLIANYSRLGTGRTFKYLSARSYNFYTLLSFRTDLQSDQGLHSLKFSLQSSFKPPHLSVVVTKAGLQGFRPGPTQTGLYKNRRWLED